MTSGATFSTLDLGHAGRVAFGGGLVGAMTGGAGTGLAAGGRAIGVSTCTMTKIAAAAGVVTSATSAYENIQAGNYGMAALDIGLGALAGLRIRGGCFVAGTLVALSAMPGDVTQDSIWEDDGWLSRSGGTAKSVVEETESTAVTESLRLVSGQRRLVEIESVPLGARIGTRNPRPWEYDHSFPDPVREDWVKLSITVERSDGGVVDLEVLRPRDWVEQQGIAAGSLLPLNIEELEVDGLAFVHSVDPCPEIASGPDNVVTGRFVIRQVSSLARRLLRGP
jgi:hypothetical protein